MKKQSVDAPFVVIFLLVVVLGAIGSVSCGILMIDTLPEFASASASVTSLWSSTITAAPTVTPSCTISSTPTPTISDMPTPSAGYVYMPSDDEMYAAAIVAVAGSTGFLHFVKIINQDPDENLILLLGNAGYRAKAVSAGVDHIGYTWYPNEGYFDTQTGEQGDLINLTAAPPTDANNVTVYISSTLAALVATGYRLELKRQSGIWSVVSTMVVWYS